MRLRKISSRQVEEVLTRPDCTVPDRDKPARWMAQKMCNRRLIEVVYVKEHDKVIVVTVI